MPGKFMDDIVVFPEFEGMSTQYARHDLNPKKAAWMENLQPIGPNNLLCVPNWSPAIAAFVDFGESEIVKEYYFNFGGATDYLICFGSTGAGYAVSIPGHVITQFAPPGTFSTSPDVTQWGTERILIADATSGYCTWDTVTFVKYGGVSPNIPVTAGGTGYTSPVVAISGGSGSGATATATEVGGVIISINLTNPGTGYKSTDTLTIAITDGGGGSGATAVAHVWPNSPSPNPTTIAVFSGRVWLAQSNVLNYTGTGASYGGIGYDDFISGDGAGSTTLQDSDLVKEITALRSLNNYLFIFGDASVRQIGNISISGSATLFTITTLSSDQGTIYRDSIVSYNRLVLFANTVGVFAVFGSSVEKISDDMDGVFRQIDFSQHPCAAVNDINNIHCYLLLVKYKDLVNGARSIMLTFMNKKWFVISQEGTENFIVTAIINSVFTVFAAVGGDVSEPDIIPLLADPTTAVEITLSTALTSHEKPFIGKSMGRFAIAQSVGNQSALQILLESERPPSQSFNYNLSNVINFVNDSGGALQFVNQGGSALNFITNQAGFFYHHQNSGGVAGVYLGATLTGSVINFTLNSIMFEYREGAPFGTDKVAYAAVQ